jgi:hypothetical protein
MIARETPEGQQSPSPACSRRLARRSRKCDECPYKGRVSDLPDAELSHALTIPNQDFSCHMDDGPMGFGDTSCRGHWEASQLARKRGLPAVEMSEEDFAENADVMASLPRASADTPTKH